MVKKAARPNPAKAATWLRRCYAQSYPIRPTKIAEQLGITVKYIDLPLNRPGFMEASPGGRFVILLNRNDSQERRNWTCAHELGHWVMHRYMNRSFASGGTGLKEREANVFASELLMPREAVIYLTDKMSFGGMAAFFDVSLAAMHKRLMQVDVE